MKNIARILLALCLGLALVLPASATIKQVTTVSATASTILTPGNNVKTVLIQNNGSGDVRLSIDGTNNPTATTGYKLAAGTFLILTYSGSIRPPNIKAILTSGTTTTLDIVTDDLASI